MKLVITSFLLLISVTDCRGQMNPNNAIRLGLKGEQGPNLGKVIKIDGLNLSGTDRKKILNLFKAHKDLFLVKRVGDNFLAVDAADCVTDSCEYLSTTNYWYNGKRLESIADRQLILGTIKSVDDYDFNIDKKKSYVNIYISGKNYAGRKFP